MDTNVEIKSFLNHFFLDVKFPGNQFCSKHLKSFAKEQEIDKFFTTFCIDNGITEVNWQTFS
jgi:hypothetical protein